MLNLKQPWVKVATVLLCALVLMASGGIQSAYNLIESGGTPITKRQTVNFAGTGVSCADSAGISVCTINGTGVANYSQSFTSQTSVTLTHNLGTTSVLTQCFDGSNNLITPATIVITDANDVTVTFSVSQTGKCVVNGAAAGTATSVPFSGITSATNTTAAMLVGSGASLTPTGTGEIAFTTGIASIATKTTTYTFLSTDYCIVGDTTGGGFTVNLEAAPATGQVHCLKKAVAANTLTLGGNGKNIDGTANQALTVQYTSLTVQYDGTQWWIE